MFGKKEFENILFLDIETVPEYESWDSLTIEEKALFDEKTKYQRSNQNDLNLLYQRAGIWAEFGKIICISVGYISFKDEKRSFRVTSFAGKDEKTILINFKRLLEKCFNHKKSLLCAHNGKEFDFPYIARRMIIHQISLPEKLDLAGKKTWEVPHLDTLDLWKFGDYKHYKSLKLLSHVLGISSPKEDMDGSQVAGTFYVENNLEKIINYCERDTIIVAQVFFRLQNVPVLKGDEIIKIKKESLI